MSNPVESSVDVVARGFNLPASRRGHSAALTALILSIPLFIVGAASPARAQDNGGWVGKRVVQKYGDFKLRIESEAIDPKVLTTYRVEQVNGPWLWIYAPGLNGWAMADQVVPVEDAINFYTDYIRAHPSETHGYIMRAKIWVEEKKELDIALGDYNEAIRLDATKGYVYSNRGTLWHAKKEYDKAIADYNEAIRLDPADFVSLNNRGTAWEAKKEYDKAIADYDASVRLNPKYVYPVRNRGDVWAKKKDYDKAIADYSEAIRLDPKYAWAYNGRGDAYRYKKDFEKAFSDYDEAIRLDRTEGGHYLHRGYLRAAKKEYDKAIADFNEAIRLDPKHGWTYHSRGNAYRAKLDYANALADYEEAIRIEPDNAGHYNIRAWLWATCPETIHRDGKRAVVSATRACELSNWKSANDVDTLAASYAEAGDFDAAIRWQTRAIELLDDKEKAAEYRKRLDLYHKKSPYRAEVGS